MAKFDLRFESELSASPEQVWQWITSVQGIDAELSPLFKMTAPKGVASITDVEIKPGERLFRSHLYLLRFIPFGFLDLTLVEFDEGEGFVEQSPSSVFVTWRHDRRILPRPSGCTLTDHLVFEPKRFASLVGGYVKLLFNHRHKVLRRSLGGLHR